MVIKYKAKETFAAAMIDRFLDVTWHAIVRDYFNKSRGYNPPNF